MRRLAKLRRPARWLLTAVAVVLVVASGLALGVRMSGATVTTTSLGDVQLQVEPALRGEVDAYIPIADWGVRARAFRAPFEVHAEPRSVDRSAVLRAAAGERALLGKAVDDIDAAAASAIRRAVLFAIAGAALTSLLAALLVMAVARWSRRRAALVFLALTLLGAGVAVGSALSARSTFDTTAFERPSFYARGGELLQLLDSAAKGKKTASKYRTKVQGSLQTFSTMLAEGRIGTETFAGGDPGRRALLGSDLHGNRLVVDPLRSLARDGRPIFLVGDFAHEGNEGEARVIAPALAKLGPRVVAVSGNHDSSQLMRALARAGMTVLTGRGRLRGDGTIAPGGPVIDVDGMRVAGVSDPLEWTGKDPADPKRKLGFAQMEDGDEARRAAEQRLIAWFDALPERPEIVLVHQNGLAQELARTLNGRGDRTPLVILTGHDHKQHVERHGEIVVADAGSVGAGGLLGIADERVGVGELHFAPGSAELQTVDLIEVDPLRGGAQAERVVVEGARCEDEDEECTLSGG